MKIAGMGRKTLLVSAIVFLIGLGSFKTKSTSASAVKLNELRQYRHGDILIGGAIHITDKNEDGDLVVTTVGMIIVETINMIIDQINQNKDILPGIRLGSVIIDTSNSDIHALKQVLLGMLPFAFGESDCQSNCDETGPKPIFAGVVGSDSSEVSITLAKVLRIFNVTQISYWATSPELSDKSRFDYFFRTVPPDNYQVKAMLSFIQSRGWNYISVLYREDAYGNSGFKELVKQSSYYNICISFDMSIPTTTLLVNYNHILRDLVQQEKSKVVVLFSITSEAEGLISSIPNVPGAKSLFWIASDGWTTYLPGEDRSESYLANLEGTVGFLPKFVAYPGIKEYFMNVSLDENSGVNVSRNPWFASFVSAQNNCSLKEDVDHLKSRNCFDDERIDLNSSGYPINIPSVAEAVLAYVHALDAYHHDICKGEPGVCAEMNLSRGTNKLSNDLVAYLRNVSFSTEDMRTFSFDKQQDGPPSYNAFLFESNHKISDTQTEWKLSGTYIDGEYTEILTHDKMNQTFSVCSQPCGKGEAKILETEVCCWHCLPCGTLEFVHSNMTCVPCPPKQKPNEDKDGCVPMEIKDLEFDSIHAILSLTLGTVGVLFTVAVAGVFIRYRDTAIVRASGKELCFFVLAGISLTLLNCFTVIAPASPFTCIASGIIFCLGPTIMYSGLLMKTIRVVFIFQSKGILTVKTKVYLQPLQLILITMAVSSVQVLIMITWFTIANPVPEIVYATGYDLMRCCGNLIHAKIIIGLGYPFLLIITCTILATINRNVPTGFKETRYVGFTMYTTLVIWLAFLSIFLPNDNQIWKKLTTVSVALSLSAITVLVCLFVPRSYTILFEPEANTSETVMSIKRSSARIVTVSPPRTTETIDAISHKVGPERQDFEVGVQHHDEVKMTNDTNNCSKSYRSKT